MRCSRTVFFSGMIIIASALLTSCKEEKVLLTEHQISLLNKWLDSSYQTPAERIIQEFQQGRSVILAQDMILRGDTVDLVRSLVPLFYSLGIRNIGLYQFNTTSQKELDWYCRDANPGQNDAISSPMPFLAYIEYREFLDYIKDLNNHKKLGEEAINIIALGERGSISSPRVNQLLEEENCFLWLKSTDLASIPHTETDEVKPLVLLHHGPGPDGLIWNELILHTRNQRPLRDATFAFNPDTPPFHLWKYNHPAKPDIVIVTVFPYRAVTTVPGYLTRDITDEVLANFPEIQIRNPQNLLPSRLNRIVYRQVKRYARSLRNF